MKMVFAMALLLALASCSDKKEEVNKGKTACEEASLLVLSAARTHCEAKEECTLCQKLEWEAEVLDILSLGEGGEPECQGRVLSAAEACLKNPKRCQDCVGLFLEAQCEGRSLSEREALLCMAFLGV